MTDKTLFIKKNKDGIILVQVYVDDIIFESTNEDMCEVFIEAMKSEFESHEESWWVSWTTSLAFK